MRQWFYRLIVPDRVWRHLPYPIPLDPYWLDRCAWGRHQPIIIRRKEKEATS